MNELWTDYIHYLFWKCNLYDELSDYDRLFFLLSEIDFEWSIERDENREGDGLALRDYYDVPDHFDQKVVDMFYDRKCSVLEMLIALAIRVDDTIIGDPADPHPEEFFMEMIDNLGLGTFKNKRNYKDATVKRIIEKWLSRKFDKTGYGSPFPISACHDRRDQRELEIWDQMNSYLFECYRM